MNITGNGHGNMPNPGRSGSFAGWLARAAWLAFGIALLGAWSPAAVSQLVQGTCNFTPGITYPDTLDEDATNGGCSLLDGTEGNVRNWTLPDGLAIVVSDKHAVRNNHASTSNNETGEYRAYVIDGDLTASGAGFHAVYNELGGNNSYAIGGAVTASGAGSYAIYNKAGAGNTYTIKDGATISGTIKTDVRATLLLGDNVVASALSFAGDWRDADGRRYPLAAAQVITIDTAVTATNDGYIMDGGDMLTVTAAGSIITPSGGAGSGFPAILSAGAGNAFVIAGTVTAAGSDDAHAIHNHTGGGSEYTIAGTVTTGGTSSHGIYNEAGGGNMYTIAGTGTVASTDTASGSSYAIYNKAGAGNTYTIQDGATITGSLKADVAAFLLLDGTHDLKAEGPWQDAAGANLRRVDTPGRLRVVGDEQADLSGSYTVADNEYLNVQEDGRLAFVAGLDGIHVTGDNNAIRVEGTVSIAGPTIANDNAAVIYNDGGDNNHYVISGDLERTGRGGITIFNNGGTGNSYEIQAGAGIGGRLQTTVRATLSLPFEDSQIALQGEWVDADGNQVNLLPVVNNPGDGSLPGDAPAAVAGVMWEHAFSTIAEIGDVHDVFYDGNLSGPFGINRYYFVTDGAMCRGRGGMEVAPQWPDWLTTTDIKFESNGMIFTDSAGRTFTASVTVSGIPPAGSGGTAVSLTLAADDGGGTPACVEFTVPILAPPAIAGSVGTQETLVGDEFSLDLSGLALSDPDGDDDAVTLAATLADGSALPAWLEFDDAALTLSGEPAAADAGDLAVRLLATDGDGIAGTPLDFTLRVREVALQLASDFVSHDDRVHVSVTQVGGIAPAADVSYAIAVSSPTVNVITGGAAAGDSHTLNLTVPANSPAGSVHETFLAFDRMNSRGAAAGTNDIAITLQYSAAAANAFLIAGPAMVTQQVPTRPPSGIPTLANPLVDVTLTVTEPWTNMVPENTFTEPDGEALAYSAGLADGGDLPPWLGFAPDTRTFSGTPPSTAISIGSMAIQVIAEDPLGYGAVSVFTLSLAPVAGNAEPTLVAANAVEDAMPLEDADFTLAIAAAFADSDMGDTLTYHAAVTATPAPTTLPSALALLADSADNALPDWLSFDSAAGEFSGVPDQAAYDAGTFTVVITANDGRGGEVSDSFTITPVNVNDVPTVTEAGIPNQRAAVGRLFSLDASAAFMDEDGDTLAFAAMPAGETGGTLPAWLGFDTGTGMFSGTPAPADLTAMDIRITVTASDGSADGMAAATFSLQVAERPNREPTLADGIPDQQARVGSPFMFTFPATAFRDSDGDALSYGHEVSPSAPWLTFAAATRSFSGTPPLAAAGMSFTIRVAADDGYQRSFWLPFALAVIPTRPPRLAVPIPDRVAVAGLAFSYRLPEGTFTDPDGHALTYTHSAVPALPWLSLDAGTGAFSGTVPAAAAGLVAAVTVTAADGFGGTARDTFMLRVNNVPSAAATRGLPGVTAYAGFTFRHYVGDGSFQDGDLDRLSFTAALMDGESLPGWLSFNEGTGEFSGVPGAGDVSAAPIAIAVRASDGLAASAPVLFNLTVEAFSTVGTVTGSEPRAVNFPYVALDLPAASYRACLSVTLTEGDDGSWGAEYGLPAPGCVLPAGDYGVPRIADYAGTVILRAPWLRYGEACLSAEFRLDGSGGYTWVGAAAVECPATPGGN